MEGQNYARSHAALSEMGEATQEQATTGVEHVVEMIALLDSGEHPDAESKGIAYGAIGVWELIREMEEPDQLFDVIDALNNTEGQMAILKHIGMDIAAEEISFKSFRSKDMSATRKLVEQPYFNTLGDTARAHTFKALFERGCAEDITFLQEHASQFPLEKLQQWYSKGRSLNENLGAALFGKMNFKDAVTMMTELVGGSGDVKKILIADMVFSGLLAEVSPLDIVDTLEQSGIFSQLEDYVIPMLIESCGTPELKRLVALAGSLPDEKKETFADLCGGKPMSAEIIQFYLGNASEVERTSQRYLTLARMYERANEMSGVQE